MKGIRWLKKSPIALPPKQRKVYTWWGTYGEMLPSLADHDDGGYSSSSFSQDIRLMGLYTNTIP